MTTSPALPYERTPFFERRRSLVRIRELLAEHRLVTLTGVGGTGKTRLALRAARLEADSGRSVAWTSLAPVEGPELVAATVCGALEVRPPAGLPPSDALVRQLQGWSGLLVLDNCEHLIDACAALALHLLEHCSALHILATSRERLGVPEEVLWPVPTFEVPNPVPADGLSDFEERRGVGARRRVASSRATGSLRDLAEVESVQFFVARARALKPDFELNAENAPAVGRLCALLHGIPLALELAAARIPVLGPAEIVEHLDRGQGLALLRRQDRGGPARHRTMQSALEWSHGLLEEGERRLFGRLGVFAGGATIEMIQAVCTDDPADARAASQILDRLTRLVDRSLVVVEDLGTPARFHLLEPVRRFALEQLAASDERPAVELRHALAFLEKAEARAGGLRGPKRSETLEWFEGEHDNLRSAWDHAVSAEMWLTLARLTRALFWYWNFGGHFAEGRARTDVALDRLQEAFEGQHSTSDRAGEEHSPGSSPPAGLPDLLWASGTLAWMQGNPGIARKQLERCVVLCREWERNDLLPLALRELAGVHLALEEPDAAAELYQESAERLARPTSAPEAERDWDRALALSMLADTRTTLGAPEAAEAARREARALFQRVGDPWGLSLAHFGLAVTAARQGELSTARADAHRALELQRTAGDDWNAGQVQMLLGEIEWHTGNLDRARDTLTEGVRAFREVGDHLSLGHTLRALAAVEAERGRSLRAVRLAGAAQALSESVEASYPYGITPEAAFDRVFRKLEASVGDEVFAAEWAFGAALSLGRVLESELAGPDRTRSLEGTPVPEGDPSAATARLHVLGLGAPRVFRSGRRLETSEWTYALPRHLLYYLLLNGPRTREQIGLDFWPEASSDQLRGRLRTALYHLRRALGGTEWVRYREQRYAIERADGVWFDVEAFEAGIGEARRCLDREPYRAASRLERAVELYGGELLEGESTGRWASTHRDRLRRAHRDAVMTLAEQRMREGAHRVAADWYRRAIAADDLSEEAYLGLAEALAEAGDRAGALRTLQQYQKLLARELDSEPSREWVELRSRLER
jgi:predicted ATPase/DNA-binding SARP family transcriptional activator